MEGERVIIWGRRMLTDGLLCSLERERERGRASKCGSDPKLIIFLLQCEMDH